MPFHSPLITFYLRKKLRHVRMLNVKEFLLTTQALHCPSNPFIKMSMVTLTFSLKNLISACLFYAWALALELECLLTGINFHLVNEFLS